MVNNNIGKYPGGGECQPMSLGGKHMKSGREKGGHRRQKERKGKETGKRRKKKRKRSKRVK
jgi:hypothetical protein